MKPCPLIGPHPIKVLKMVLRTLLNSTISRSFSSDNVCLTLSIKVPSILNLPTKHICTILGYEELPKPSFLITKPFKVHVKDPWDNQNSLTGSAILLQLVLVLSPDLAFLITFPLVYASGLNNLVLFVESFGLHTQLCVTVYCDKLSIVISCIATFPYYFVTSISYYTRSPTGLESHMNVSPISCLWAPTWLWAPFPNFGLYQLTLSPFNLLWAPWADFEPPSTNLELPCVWVASVGLKLH